MVPQKERRTCRVQTTISMVTSKGYSILVLEELKDLC
jgi:DNA-binding HxlR family transcriptional regulator